MRLTKAGFFAVLIAVVAVCSIGQANAQTPLTFFGMSTNMATNVPQVPFGTLGHGPMAWTVVQPTARGTFNWAPLDAYTLAAPRGANGLAQIEVTLSGGTPGWAVANPPAGACRALATGGTSCSVPPDNIVDWTNFISAFVNHYNGTATTKLKNKLVTLPQVQLLEPWNEVNVGSFWTGTVSQLVTLACAAYPIIKQSSPNSLVGTPSVVWSKAAGVTLMTQYLQAGGTNCADMLDFHAYTSVTGGNLHGASVPYPDSAKSTNASLQTMYSSFRQVADLNGMSGKPLITTEGGWGVDGVTDLDTQEAWIARFELMSAALAPPNIILFQNWYTWGKNSPSGDIESSSGAPTSAGLAYALVTGWLVGDVVQPALTVGNITSIQIGQNLAVWDTSQTCSNGVCTTAPYIVPLGYGHVQTLDGTITAVTPGSIINLGAKSQLLMP